MAKRIHKRDWEKKRPLIEGLYQKHHLVEVIQLMSERHGFHAKKRQYVYRLEQWGVRKYRVGVAEIDSPLGYEEVDEDDDGHGEEDDDPPGETSLMIAGPDNKDPFTPLPLLENGHSPYSDGLSPSQKREDLPSTPATSSEDSQAWHENQRQRLDLVLAVPNNTFTSERCLTLWRRIPHDIQAGPLGQSILSACVRLGVGHEADRVQHALDDMHPRIKTRADYLRLSLFRYFIQPSDMVGVSGTFRDIDRFLKHPEPDLCVFLLIVRLVSQQMAHHEQPRRLPQTFGAEDDMVTDFASKLAKYSESTKILRTSIEWCQHAHAMTTGRGTHLNMQGQLLTPEQRRQLGIAEVACSLTKYLLCEPHESPRPWAQQSQSQLGISPVTCIAAVTRMASNNCPSSTRLSFYEQVDYRRAYSLLLGADERSLWKMFLHALLEVDSTSLMASYPHVFQSDSHGDQYGQGGSPSHMKNSDFFNALHGLVESFVCEELTPETREADLEGPPACPDLDITGANSYRGSHSPATPAMAYPASAHNSFVADATDMAIFSQLAHDPTFMGEGFFGQLYCDTGIDQAVISPFYEPGLYRPA